MNVTTDFDRVFKLSEVYYPCVYFLIRNGEIVYVGQTNKGLERAISHVKDKSFDSIGIIKCKEEELNEKETFYIAKYRPLYNKCLTNALSAKNIKVRLKELGLDVNKRDIDWWIKTNVPNYYVYNGGYYISGDDVPKCIGYFVSKKNISR